MNLDSAVYAEKKLDYQNDLFKKIDSITREDIDNLSRKVFGNAPIYSIAASKDTLEYNKDFLNELESKQI